MLTRRLTASALALTLSAVLFAGCLRPSDTRESSSPFAKSDAALPTLRGDEAVASLKQEGLYDSLKQAMSASRYRVNLESDAKSSQVVYRAPNPAQGFDASFTQQGVSIKPHASANQDEQPVIWQTAVSLVGYGYKNDFVMLAAPTLEAQDNRIELRHTPVDGSDRRVTEWYVNRAEGLEQGFVIHAQPANKIEGEPLRVAMMLSGDLKAEVADEGQAVRLSTPGGMEALRYEKLFVTDAAGRELLSQIRVEAGEIRIEVEDEKASYPITIDPTFTQQVKLLSMNGDRFDQFGVSVSISGETAIIGAPGDGVGDGQGVGAAFIFIRNAPTAGGTTELRIADCGL